MSNRWKAVVAAVAVVAVLGPALAIAQGRPMGPGPGGPGPHAFHALRSLDLTPEQKTSVEQIMTSHRTTGEAARDQMMAARRALMEKVHAATFDEAGIRAAAGAVAALEADRAVATAKLFQEIRGVLTPEQQAQFEQQLNQPPPMRGERGPRHGRGGPGSHGGRS